MHTNNPGLPGLTPLVRGMSRTRQAGTRQGECAACSRSVLDFVIYDFGPSPTPERPERRRTVLICMMCSEFYRDWVINEIEQGRGDDGRGHVMMHDMLRRYLKIRRPSFVLPED